MKVLPFTLGLAKAWAGISVYGRKGEFVLIFVSKWQFLTFQVARLEKQSAHCAYRWVPPLIVSRGKSHNPPLAIWLLFRLEGFLFLRSKWVNESSTITYDSLTLSHGLGSFDLESGEWKSEVIQRFYTWHYLYIIQIY